MKRLTVTMALLAAIMIGCGGGGSGDTNTGSKDDTGASNFTNDGFEYPGSFNSEDGLIYEIGSRISELNDRENKLLFLTVFTEADLPIAPKHIDDIEKNPNLVRSHCEKGSVSASGTYDFDDVYSGTYGSGNGVVKYTTSSGISYDVVGMTENDECSNEGSFLDGSISYDVQHKDDVTRDENGVGIKKEPISTYIAATLGSKNAPFFINDSHSYFSGSIGYVGSFTYNRNDKDGIFILRSPKIEIFEVKSNVKEPYTKGDYEKIWDVTFKDYYSKIDANKDEQKKNYIAEFNHKGHSFKLHYTSDILKTSHYKYTYYLEVIGMPEKNIKASYFWDTKSGETVITYTKNGKTVTKRF